MFEFVTTKGAPCQQRRESQTPLCVVTGLKHTDVLFSHIPLDDSEWMIQSMSCTEQRFWTTSTATITLACSSEYPNFFPPALPVVRAGTDLEHNLQPEDEICIWLGYVDQLYIPKEDLPKLMSNPKNTHLLRVFVGVVDTISPVGTDKGYKYTIQCRDRMRYLMDTHVSFNPFDSSNSKSYMNKAFGGSETSAYRSDVILSLAQLGVGFIDKDKAGAAESINIHGIAIKEGIVQDLGKLTQPVANKDQAKEYPKRSLRDYLPPDYLYNHGTKPLASTVFNRILDLDSSPLFNIFTSRPPFNTETVSRQFTIEEQIPAEIIKFLSNQEIYPTELFSSPIDGGYYYVPRTGDLAGLNDPSRFHRTYYFRYSPPGTGNNNFLDKLKEKYTPIEFVDVGDASQQIPERKYTVDLTEAFRETPDKAQSILNFKQDQTTVSMITNYIISNNSPNSTEGGQNVLINMSARPAFLSGLPIAGRNRYIVDDTISTITEGVALGVQMARTHSKDMRGASMTILGDPSMCPGEIVQVIGNPAYPHLSELPEILRERTAVYEYLQQEATNYTDALQNIKDKKEGESKPENVIGSNKPFTRYVAESPKSSAAHVLGKPIKDSKSAIDPIAACVFEESSTIIREGQGTTEQVSLSAKPQTATTANSVGRFDSLNPTALDLSKLDPNAKFYYPHNQYYPITSPYGWRTHPLTGNRRFHAGVDLGSPKGTPILASRSGNVILAGDKGNGYGKYVVIQHAGEFQTLYGHMIEVNTTEGASVNAGDIIGLVGSTGASSGPHLHFEVKKLIGGKYTAIQPDAAKQGYVNLGFKTFTSASRAPKETASTTATATPAIIPGVTPGAAPKKNNDGTKASLDTGKLNDNDTASRIAVKSGYVETYTQTSNLVTAHGHQMTPATASAFTAMQKKAKEDGITLSVVSAFRSVLDQTKIFNNKVAKSGAAAAAKFSAPGGYSQHHTGQALDINSTSPSFANTPAYKWLKTNAPKFGFMLSYANEQGDLGAEFEPWHWVYVGDSSSMRNFTDFIKRANDNKFDPFLGDKALKELNEKAPTAGNVNSENKPVDLAGNPVTGNTTAPKGTLMQDELWRKSHFAQEPVSMFRVDAVKHDFNTAGKAGYTTEVILLPVFGA